MSDSMPVSSCDTTASSTPIIHRFLKRVLQNRLRKIYGEYYEKDLCTNIISLDGATKRCAYSLYDQCLRCDSTGFWCYCGNIVQKGGNGFCSSYCSGLYYNY
jgi:hypothetical protein